MGDRTFAAFVRGLPTEPQLVRLFRRDKDWISYTAHGKDARLIAERFFHGTHVIRSEFGVDSLAVSGRLFGSVTSALLSSNFLIELWSQNAAGDWEVTARASPGDPRAIEQILREYNLSMPDLTQQAVMGALYASGGPSAHDIQIGLAYMDVNSSKAFVTQIREGPDLSGLSAVVAASGVRECLLPAGVQTESGSAYGTIAGLLENCGVKVTQMKRTMFQSPSMEVEQELERLLLVPDGSGQQRQQAVQNLLEMPLAITACVALLRHLDLYENPTAAGTLTMQQDIVEGTLSYDNSVAKALSLLPSPSRKRSLPASATSAVPTIDGGVDRPAAATKESLLEILDETMTGMGRRLLQRWLRRPSVDKQEIEFRRRLVRVLVDDSFVRGTLRDTHLKSFPDLEKLACKLRQRPIVATLVDLLDIYRAAARIGAIAEALLEVHIEDEGVRESFARTLSEPLQRCSAQLVKLRALVEELVDTDRLARRGMSAPRVRPAFSEQLNLLHTDMTAMRKQMDAIADSVSTATGLEREKVKLERTPVHGYHLRVTKRDQSKLDKVPSLVTISVQKAGVLFATTAFKAISDKYEKVLRQYLALQEEIVQQAMEVASSYQGVLLSASSVIALLDAIGSLAHVAAVSGWVEPAIADEEGTLEITGLKHPVVELAIGSAFVPNDVHLSTTRRLAIITGPNMGGKSTYIRSIGAAVILNQIGSYVPATSATMSIYTRILVRVGASDSQMRGVSTFMAEMLDTNSILRKAGPRSLVIIDELGRGTSTQDGFGIAWAVCERLATIPGCSTLFATHFHELTTLSQEREEVTNLHTSAMFTDGRIHMMYRVQDGPSDKSFGVQVAALAQFPEEIIKDAETYAANWENRVELSQSQGSDSQATKRARTSS